MTSASALTVATRRSPGVDIARFLCAVSRTKQQDQNAAQAYAWALQLDRNCAEAWNGLGRFEMGRGRIDAAIDAFTMSIRMNPRFAEAYIHRGVAMDRHGMSEAALMDLRKAADLDPSLTIAEMLIYGILENLERYDEAFKVLEAGLAKRPTDPDLLFCRATLELAARNYETGWKDYEYRPTKLQLNQMLDEYPEWDGSPLDGKRIVICREQGLGDEIMFARYVAEVAKRGGHVILYCYPALARLFSRIPGVAEIVTSDSGCPTEFDCWVGMGSLPLKLGMPLKAELAYLTVENPEPKSKKFRVGLCWQGNKAHARDGYRSLPLAALKPLLAVTDVEFVSLQQGDTESGLDDIGNRCHDLEDMARAMTGLDLVITVDTAIAHLAGALGVSAWILLGKPSDWRWNTELYQTATAYWNEGPKKWASLISDLASKLDFNVKWASARGCFAAYEEAHSEPKPAVSVAETRHGKMAYFTSDVWLGRSLAMYGEWSEGECELYRRVIGPEDSVVEVGANIGAHTIELAKLAKSVVALEPSPEIFPVLSQNIASLTPNNVEWIRIAAGAEAGRATLSVKPNNPGGTEVRADDSGDVEIETLDSILGDELACNFLKLDCEGSELAVLQGAEKVIERCRPLLYVENDRAEKSEALMAWIHAHGYRMYQHNTPLFSANNFRGETINVFGNIVSAMLFCVPRERYDLRPSEWGMDRVRVVNSPAK